jgi:hypothetical protein
VPDLPGWALPAGTRPKPNTALASNRAQTVATQQQVARPQSVQPQQTAPVAATTPVAQPVVAQPIAATKATPPPPQQAQVHSISEPEQKFRAARKMQETILGIALANNILETLGEKLDSGEIKGEKFGLATAKLDAAVALLTKVREVAERTHASAMRTLLLRHELQNLDTIPTFQKLYRVALDMQVVPAIEKRAA